MCVFLACLPGLLCLRLIEGCPLATMRANTEGTLSSNPHVQNLMSSITRPLYMECKLHCIHFSMNQHTVSIHILYCSTRHYSIPSHPLSTLQMCVQHHKLFSSSLPLILHYRPVYILMYSANFSPNVFPSLSPSFYKTCI